MANMVTRTIFITRCALMCVDTEKGEVFNAIVDVPRTWRDEAKLLKRAKEIYGETDSIKVVSIASKEEIGTLYGMSEDDFIAHANELPPREVQKKESDAANTEEK